jgi:hypothetical protein
MIPKRFTGTRMALLSLAICSTVALADDNQRAGTEHWSHARNWMVVDLPVATQGPLWPPAEVTDENGNFLVVGTLLKEVRPGVVEMVPRQAALVSKETVPPLDANGVEDPDNWFGAPHKVIRPLNLRRGSPDLDLVLYSNSFGPAVGSGGAPRIPRIGESTYNLNKDLIICQDSFPTITQSTNYFRPSYPLHKVPVIGFQGDGVAYDPDTHEPYDPKSASNRPSCAATGCSGEDVVDTRRTKPITLGDWLRSDGEVRIQLTRPNRRGQYTHAKFRFELRDMLPNAVYTVWAVRERTIPVPGSWKRRDIDPLATPNILATDNHGRASAEWEVPNPFPAKATDTNKMRIIGLSVVMHSDYQPWGACFSRFGPGVDVHVVFNTLNVEADVPGTLPDMTNFVTVAR